MRVSEHDTSMKMDDHDLHLIDQDALDLRHSFMPYNPRPPPKQIDTMTSYVAVDQHASTALHCTCDTALFVLCKLLQIANTSPELVEFISKHDINPAVQNHLSVRVWDVDMHILAFLSVRRFWNQYFLFILIFYYSTHSAQMFASTGG